MKNSIFTSKMGLAIALTTTLATFAQPQPASAQILEIAAGALNALVRSKQPQPQVIQQQVPVPVPTAPNGPEFNVGTNNANGNSLNLCVSNCLPVGSNVPPNVYRPPLPHTIVQQRPAVQQNTSTSTSTTQTVQQSSSQSSN